MSTNHTQEHSAKLFYNRNNQAVRFPKGLELDADEVLIRKEGDHLIISPKPRSWDDYFERAQCLSSDFPNSIEDLSPQEREPL